MKIYVCFDWCGIGKSLQFLVIMMYVQQLFGHQFEPAPNLTKAEDRNHSKDTVLTQTFLSCFKKNETGIWTMIDFVVTLGNTVVAIVGFGIAVIALIFCGIWSIGSSRDEKPESREEQV